MELMTLLEQVFCLRLMTAGFDVCKSAFMVNGDIHHNYIYIYTYKLYIYIYKLYIYIN